MGYVIVLLFNAAFFLPLFLMHRKHEKEPLKYYLFAFLMGIGAFALSVGIELAFGYLVSLLHIQALVGTGIGHFIYGILDVLIVVATTEELTKFLLAKQIIKKVPNLSMMGCMLIFAMAGMGFELVESVQATDILSGFLRGITDLHLFFQMWMGAFMWKAWQAKKENNKVGYRNNLLIAILVPILVHFVYDYLLFGAIALMNSTTTIAGMDLSDIYIFGSYGIAIVFVVAGLIKGYKTLHKEKLQLAI